MAPDHDPMRADSRVVSHAQALSDVVFDLDGTLVALEMPWQIWIDEILQFVPTAHRHSLQALMCTPGAAWSDRLNALIRDGVTSVADVVDVSRKFESKHQGYRANPALIAAVREISSLGVAVHLWTNNVSQTAHRVLSELSVIDCFTTLVARDDVTLGKPDREGWSRIGANPRTSMIVGDSRHDQLAAERIGASYYHIDYFRNSSDHTSH